MATPEKRLYYGWVIVAVGFCTMLLVQGSFASSGVLFAALTSGLVLSGASIGALILVPGVQYVVNYYGWRLAYTVLGLLVIGCLVPLNALLQRHRPADL